MVRRPQGVHPEKSPRLDGWVPMSELADELVGAGQLTALERDNLVATIEHAARPEPFTMTLTMHALIAVAPVPT